MKESTFMIITSVFIGIILSVAFVVSAKPTPQPSKLDLINTYTARDGITVTDYGKEDRKHYWVKVVKDGKNYTMIVSKTQVLEYYEANK